MVRVFVGGQYAMTNISSTAVSSGFNSTLDRIEIVCQAQANTTITRVASRRSSSATGNSFLISLQGVNANGTANGTILGGGSPASMTYTPVGANNNVVIWHDLDNPYTVTKGELFAIVTQPTTISGTINFTYRWTNMDSPNHITPVGFLVNESVYSVPSASLPFWGYASANAYYGFPIQDYMISGFVVNPSEFGFTFTIGDPSTFTYKLNAINTMIAINNVSSDFIVSVYDANGTMLQTSPTFSGNSGFLVGTNPALVTNWKVGFSHPLANLNCGQEYTIGFSMPVAGAGNGISTFPIVFNDANVCSNVTQNMFGVTCNYATRANSTDVWTANTQTHVFAQFFAESVTPIT